jgi:tRNA A-37 threonylcarbamoyl transferase component Bud32
VSWANLVAVSEEIQVTGFELIAKLGEGGMGAVHRALQTDLDREVALKILLPHAFTDERLQARFRREAEIQGTLVHPNLVRVYDAGQDGEIRWIAMELVAGGTLAQVIDRRGRWPAEFLAPGLLQLATGLAFLHEHEVIHRDLKPGNVMLSDAGIIKITDFGLARRAGQTALTATGSMVGTLAYMSPEAVTGREVGTPNDIYALGLIAYEMATGTLPYKGEDMSDWVAAIIMAPINPPSTAYPEISPDLDQLILDLLAREPEKRPTAAEACRRLQLMADTGGMTANSVHGAVRKLLDEVRDADGSAKTPSWRGVEVKPALDAVAALGAVAEPASGDATMGAEPATEESMPSGEVFQAARVVIGSKPEAGRLRVGSKPEAGRLAVGSKPGSAGAGAAAGGEVSAAAGSSWAVPLIVLALGLAAVGGVVVWRSSQAVAVDPGLEKRECEQRLTALNAAAGPLVKRVREAPALLAAVKAWEAAKAAHDAVPPAEKSKREKASDAVLEAAATAEGEAKKVAEAARDDGGEQARAAGPCPARGVYALNAAGALTCDAPGHAGAPPLAEQPASGERAAYELALVSRLIAASNEFEGCVDRQRQILDASVGYSSLEDVKREKSHLENVLNPPGESYTLSTDRVLECSKHPSVQKIAKRVPAFSAMPAKGK